MTIKHPTFAFAIKYKANPKTFEHATWLAALTTAVETLPSIKIEGFNLPHETPIEIKVPDVEIREGNTYSEYGRYVTETTDVILVGVSNKYDVSFGNLENFKLHSLLPIYSIPVFDLVEDIEIILARFTEFMMFKIKAAARKEKNNTCTSITYHSNFIRVGNSRIDYDDTATLKSLLKNKKKVKKETEVPYILKNIFTIQ